MSQILEAIWNSRALKRRITQKLADCNSAWKRRTRDMLFQSLAHACLVSRYYKTSEVQLARKEVLAEVADSKLLRTTGESGVSKFTW